VQDREIKFGYAVTGAIDPKRILTNAGAKPGDRLILTKALGTGIVGTAIKFGRAPQAVIDAAVNQMRTLNKVAAETITAASPHIRSGVHACTDITGFGLAGHASEMAAASHVTIEFDASALPIIPGVLAMTAENKSGGMTTNKEHFLPGIEFLSGNSFPSGSDAGREAEARRDLIFDPQTSGGLLISAAASSAEAVLAGLQDAGISAVFVGSVTAPSGPRLRFG
jgi:selenide,water dikinase